MNTPKLGELITGPAHRDAIHIAVAPAIAEEDLESNDRLQIVPDSYKDEDGEKVRVVKASRPELTIGIADPFLRTRRIWKGNEFWMLLVPNSITSLRHEWTHPAFKNFPVNQKAYDKTLEQSESELWIRNFAGLFHQTYDCLMEAADAYIQYDNFTFDNTERYKSVNRSLWPLFWLHYRVITGQEVPKGKEEDVPFTCSC